MLEWNKKPVVGLEIFFDIIISIFENDWPTVFLIFQVYALIKLKCFLF